jgi:hypothetical protein
VLIEVRICAAIRPTVCFPKGMRLRNQGNGCTNFGRYKLDTA